jgi:hypothetical protein
LNEEHNLRNKKYISDFCTTITPLKRSPSWNSMNELIEKRV